MDNKFFSRALETVVSALRFANFALHLELNGYLTIDNIHLE